VSKIRKKSIDLAIAILIGGKSSRFGSDKGLFEFSGKPLISYLLDTLYGLKYDIFIVANSIRQVQDYINKVDIKILTGFIVDDKKILTNKTLHTPIIGLFSAFKELKKLNYSKVLALSCDSPLVRKEVLQCIIEQCKNFDCCIPQWDNGFLEPLFTLYPIQKALTIAKKNIKKKNFKLINLLNKNWNINYVSIENTIRPFDENLLSFININEPSDIEKLSELAK
jgi:molybdopterin-guanine dinucleotide biosynthesis protein A